MCILYDNTLYEPMPVVVSNVVHGASMLGYSARIREVPNRRVFSQKKTLSGPLDNHNKKPVYFFNCVWEKLQNCSSILCIWDTVQKQLRPNMNLGLIIGSFFSRSTFDCFFFLNSTLGHLLVCFYCRWQVR